WRPGPEMAIPRTHFGMVDSLAARVTKPAVLSFPGFMRLLGVLLFLPISLLLVAANSPGPSASPSPTTEASPSPSTSPPPSPSPSPSPSPTEPPSPSASTEVGTPFTPSSSPVAPTLSGIDVITSPPFVFLPIAGGLAILLSVGYWLVSVMRRPRIAPLPAAAVVHRATRPDYAAGFGTPPPTPAAESHESSAWNEPMPHTQALPAAPP